MTADAVNPSSLLDEASATTIAFEDDAVQVPAAVIAYGFDLETQMVQSLMRSGELTSLCEKGENEDMGRKAYPSPSGRINILYVMGFAARPIARSARKAA